MGEPRDYQLLLVEQVAVPVEEELRNAALFQGEFRCRREEWTEALTLSPRDDSVDLILPVAGREMDRALRLMSWLERRPTRTPTLAVLPAETPPEILATASQVVDDFVLWPFRSSELRQRLVRIIGEKRSDTEIVRERLNRELGLSSLVGTDPAFLRTIEAIPRIAQGNATVLITGETGTGKELCARAIHHLSARRNYPFVPVDCAAFPEHLLENELFGHARGAFTDARADQKGLAALAEGGTLFLDEIDALSLPGQAKLLRFLEDRVYRPLGSERFSRADVRIVAASNRDLENSVRAGQFRPDLFFRLNVFGLRLVPLRERREDVALLARHFLERFTANPGRDRKLFSPAALRRLMLHDWPGNVRELLNVVQKAVAFAEGPQILSAHIHLPSPGPTSCGPGDPSVANRFREARTHAIDEFEKAYIEEVLARHHGNITRAAREAGKDRRAFGRLVKKHRINRLLY